MLSTSNIGYGICRSLRVVAVPIAMLSLTLPACGDKEEAAAPSPLAEISQARETANYEKSQRLLAESRLGTVLWLAVLGAGGALMLGLAIGSSFRRETGGAHPEGPETGI